MKPVKLFSTPLLRTLTITLSISLLLNVALLSYFFYDRLANVPVFLQKSIYLASSPPLAISLSNQDIYILLQQLSNEELIQTLLDSRWAEDGLKVRDIALGILIQERYFNIEKALGVLPPQKEWIIRGRPIPILKDLTETQIQQIYSFGRSEQWPLTSQGLYELLKSSSHADLLLENAFMLTPTFQKLSRLFGMLDKKSVLSLALDGSWKLVMSIPDNIDDATRQQVLLSFINEGSTQAAKILLEIEPRFAFKNLDDVYVIKMLKLLTQKNTLTAKFALTMLASPRNETIKTLAIQRLMDFSEKASCFSCLLSNEKQTTAEEASVSSPVEQWHTIQPGDNLWKIAKRWKIPVSQLKQANNLPDNAILKPGHTLKIPIS